MCRANNFGLERIRTRHGHQDRAGRMTEHVAGLLLAAGSSRRLGQPKQLLPYKGRTLLDATLDVARSAPFSQRLVTVGGAAADVLHEIDFGGFDVVDSLHFADGCSSSIVSALDVVSPQATGIVMLLGDQPGVSIEAIQTLIATANAAEQPAPLAVCNYRDGVGHPFWFGRQVFDDLAELRGDKAVWKLLESSRYPVTHVPIDASIPLDVDTWGDYENLLAHDETESGATS
jgi:molybdenum cofactor cytidylyltransferase